MEQNNIAKAAQIIKEGGVVAFPTETVYGLGANALNPMAVAKIFALKERPTFDPLIVHIASVDDIARLAINVPDAALHLARVFWPGPLTIVLPKSSLVPDLVTSGLATVGLRMPQNDIALNLIKTSGCPIAAPSANKFGKLSPTSAAHVKKQLPNVDYILDGGSTHVGIESTVVGIEGTVCTFLRPGLISQADIEKALPGLFTFKTHSSHKLVAPGLLDSHYSPHKPLYIINKATVILPKSGVIAHNQQRAYADALKTVYTSNCDNMIEVAANLFAAMHQLEDDALIDNIYIEPVEENGLGLAIMDRVNKAAFQYK